MDSGDDGDKRRESQLFFLCNAFCFPFPVSKMVLAVARTPGVLFVLVEDQLRMNHFTVVKSVIYLQYLQYYAQELLCYQKCCTSGQSFIRVKVVVCGVQC